MGTRLSQQCPSRSQALELSRGSGRDRRVREGERTQSTGKGGKRRASLSSSLQHCQSRLGNKEGCVGARGGQTPREATVRAEEAVQGAARVLRAAQKG